MKRIFGMALTMVVALAGLGSAAAAADGKALYGSKCAACHGNDGVPKKLGAGSKAFGEPEFKAAATIDAIVAITHEGKGKMKPVKTITDDEAKAIAAYILTIGPAK